MMEFSHMELLVSVSTEYQSQKIAWVYNNNNTPSIKKIPAQSGTYWEEWE